MGIRAAISALCTLQETLTITDPIEARVVKAYKYTPNARDTLKGNVPCFINTYTLRPELRSSELRELIYDIRMQFACYNAERNVAADIASAFLDAYIDLLDTKITLGGTIAHAAELRGGEPTLVGFTWDSFAYIGFDLHLEVHIKDIVTFKAEAI